jgi:hypothetical protein
VPLDGPTLLWRWFVERQYPVLAPYLAAWTVREHKKLCETNAELIELRGRVAAAEQRGDRSSAQKLLRELAQLSLQRHPVSIANGRLHDTRPTAPHACSQRVIDYSVLACGAALLGTGGPEGESLMTFHKLDDGREGDLITFHCVEADEEYETDGGLYLIVAEPFELVRDPDAHTVLPPPHLCFGTGPGLSAQTESTEQHWGALIAL